MTRLTFLLRFPTVWWQCLSLSNLLGFMMMPRHMHPKLICKSAFLPFFFILFLSFHCFSYIWRIQAKQWSLLHFIPSWTMRTTFIQPLSSNNLELLKHFYTLARFHFLIWSFTFFQLYLHLTYRHLPAS